MVVIGHSMGGCISRLLITDTGDKLWLEIFDKPPEQMSALAESAASCSPTRSFSGTARKSAA